MIIVYFTKYPLQEQFVKMTKLQALCTASRRLTEVNLFSCYFINGSCILNAGLDRLRALNLTNTAETDLTLSKILHASRELTEVHLAGTRIVSLPKLEYISVPRENVHGFTRSSVLAIVGNCDRL